MSLFKRGFGTNEGHVDDLVANVEKDTAVSKVEEKPLEKTVEEGPFPLEKILTVKLETYIDFINKREGRGSNYFAQNYDMKAIEVRINKGEYPKEELSKIVPGRTEVVVEYNFFVGRIDKSECWYNHNYTSGIALIPKEK